MRELGIIVALVSLLILGALPDVGCQISGTFHHLANALHPGSSVIEVCK